MGVMECYRRASLSRVLALLAPRIDDFNPAPFEIPDIAGSNGGTLGVADGGYLAVKFTDRPPCCTAFGSNDRIRFSGGAIKGQNSILEIVTEHISDFLEESRPAFSGRHLHNSITNLGFSDGGCVDFGWRLNRKPCIYLRIGRRSQQFRDYVGIQNDHNVSVETRRFAHGAARRYFEFDIAEFGEA